MSAKVAACIRRIDSAGLMEETASYVDMWNTLFDSYPLWPQAPMPQWT